MATYIVNTHFLQGDRLYLPGEQVELDEATAGGLAPGALSVKTEDTPAPEVTVEQPGPAAPVTDPTRPARGESR